MEQVQRVFTCKLQLGDSWDYWHRLKTLKLYSLQCRRERYITIYTWKILGVVPNPTSRNNIILAQHHSWFGRTCCRKTVEGISQKLISLHVNSFTYKGPTLFNCLPRGIGNLTKCSTDVFKRHLDKFLPGLPVEPPIKNAHTMDSSQEHHTWPNNLPEQKNNLQRRTPELALMIDV